MYLHHSLGWYDIPDIFITPSEFMRNKLMEFGMPSDKLFHVPNFVDPNKFTFSNQPEDYFVYIGRLVPIKGLVTLLQAMKGINGSTKLLLIGEGPQHTELEKMAQELDLRNVKFMGHLEFHELINILSRAKFSVLPSEVYENCPMAVLESMAMGKPVIGAKIGGIPELIIDGVDGFLFESGNSKDLSEKISWMINDPKRNKEMGINARTKIEQKYNPIVHYQKIMSLYTQLLNLERP
jgi:glycosyltransferase involved in cell wall biosynthesis